MGTGVRFACITHGGPRPRGSARVPNQIKALSVESGGLEPCRCSRPVRDAGPNSHKSGPMPSMRPTSWGSARNRRARTGREAVEVVGVVSLGTVPAGTTEAQVDDMMMVLEVADEATPAPQPGYDQNRIPTPIPLI